MFLLPAQAHHGVEEVLNWGCHYTELNNNVRDKFQRARVQQQKLLLMKDDEKCLITMAKKKKVQQNSKFAHWRET